MVPLNLIASGGGRDGGGTTCGAGGASNNGRRRSSDITGTNSVRGGSAEEGAFAGTATAIRCGSGAPANLSYGSDAAVARIRADESIATAAVAQSIMRSVRVLTTIPPFTTRIASDVGAH